LPRLEDPAAFRGWILRIVDHKAADWIRCRRSDRDHERLLRERASPEAAEEPRLGELEAREPVDRLRAALAGPAAGSVE
jgi:DNA-directed RNA polymerase specialized sigma24 family protein